MTAGLIFKNNGPWGSGKGSPLTSMEADLNFWEVITRIADLEGNPPTPISVSNVTVAGASMTVHLSDGSTRGPFTLPTASFVFRGEWAPGTNYFVNDIFHVENDGAYLVNTNHQSATAFDPNDPNIDLLVPDGEPAIGRQTIWAPYGVWDSRVSNGAGSHLTAGGHTVEEINPNRPNRRYLAFAPDSEQHAQFSIVMPKSWDRGALRFKVYYSHGGGQTPGNDGVVWGLAAVAIGSGESLDVDFGTRTTVSLDAAAANTEHATPESGDLIVAGPPAVGDEVHFDLSRIIGTAGDDLDIDAGLHGVTIFYNTNAASDD